MKTYIELNNKGEISRMGGSFKAKDVRKHFGKLQMELYKELKK